MKDLCLVLPLSLQGVNIGFNGRGGLGRGSRGGGFGFRGANVLRARVRSGWGTSGVVTFIGAVALLPAVEAKSILDASSSFRGSQFRKRDGVDVHGVGVMGSSRGVDGRRESSSLQGKDTHFLSMEYLGLFNPFCDSSGNG